MNETVEHAEAWLANRLDKLADEVQLGLLWKPCCPRMAIYGAKGSDTFS